ncbi:MAG TPA: TIGR03936 family radical SAM-associated protein [Acidimicrobiales bacterium]|nr:TIGR03936 family radical SAM-associated protein [Acidimicrobiales bacterium]
MTRVRVRFAKVGKVRFTSHRDVARMWERAFRRIGLPLAYSEGFSPRPKVSFGLALPTGHESVAEYLDLDLVEGAAVPDDLPAVLSAALPVGVDATAVGVIDPRTPSLQEDVTSCTWRFTARRPDVADPVATGELAERVEALLGTTAAPVVRRHKGNDVVEDIRPGIFDLRVADGGWLEAELATKPRGLRPGDVVTAFGGDLVEHGVRRQHQWIWRDGARCEPLDGPPAATHAPHAVERAS